MTTQIPTFRFTVARQMEAYRQRIAEAIDRELKRLGKNEGDLAYAIGAEKRTVERWVAGETAPQRRYRKPVADFLRQPMETIYPDLEAEDRALRDQLDRIEKAQQEILKQISGLRAAIRALSAAPSRQPTSRTPQRQQQGKAAKAK